MKKTFLYLLLLLVSPAYAQDVIFVDAVKNCLGPGGGEYYDMKVKKGVAYELSIKDGKAIFNTNDNAEINNVGAMYVGVNRKMIITMIEKDKKTSVTTQGHIYLFFVDDAALNSGGFNVSVREIKR